MSLSVSVYPGSQLNWYTFKYNLRKDEKTLIETITWILISYKFYQSFYDFIWIYN